MPTVNFIESDGREHCVEAPVGRSLMQIAVDQDVPGIIGECGGACSCGTCHGYIDPRWADRLPLISESESFMLEAVGDRRPESRLCCQIRMRQDLDGVIVRLPADQF
jgi:2Fe-2S ferredoxin